MEKDLTKGLTEASEKLSTPDPVDWMEKHFYIPETRNDPILRGRLQLQDYQRDTIREALSRDERGYYKYSIIVWSDIKKSIKSTIAAGINLYVSEYNDWSENYIVANDLKQADSRVAHYLRRCLELNKKLGRKYSTRGYRTTGQNGSFLEAIPIDPSGEAGSNASMITFSELWGANQIAQQRMWAEMTLSPTRLGQSFRWVESYAGYTEESLLLYSLYALGVQQGEKLWPDRLYPVTDGNPAPLELFVNDEAKMLCLWNTVPRCPWQTAEYYGSEEKVLLPSDFRRMHRNQWVSSTETFLPMEWFDACRRDTWPEVDKKRHSHIISLDAGTTNDNFGLWMGCRHPEYPNDVLTQYSQKWAPVNGKIDFQGTEEKPGPERVLRKLIGEYNVVEVAYDPTQLYDLCNRLYKEGLAWFRPFNQGNDRLKADSQLRDIVRERRFWHRGEPDLRDHFQNANAQIDPQERKIRIVKRVENLKIDLCVAASMGGYELLRLNL